MVVLEGPSLPGDGPDPERERIGTAGALAGPGAGGLLGGGDTETKGHESGEGCSGQRVLRAKEMWREGETETEE